MRQNARIHTHARARAHTHTHTHTRILHCGRCSESLCHQYCMVLHSLHQAVIKPCTACPAFSDFQVRAQLHAPFRLSIRARLDEERSQGVISVCGIDMLHPIQVDTLRHSSKLAMLSAR